MAANRDVERATSPRGWPLSWGQIGALLTLLIPLGMLILGWSLRGLPNLPVPQTRPGRLPEAHWEDRAALPVLRRSFSLAVADRRIWLVGGESGATSEIPPPLAYDPTLDRWEVGPPPPAARIAPRAAALAATIYVVGGYDGGGRETALVEALDTESGRWRAVAPLATARADHAVVALDGAIYAIGGKSAGASIATVERYDPAIDRWTSLPALPTPRDGLAAAVLDGRIYAIGGRVDGAPSVLVEAFDPATQRWSRIADMQAPLADFDAVALGGTLRALRGEIHQVYDARVDRWLVGQVLPQPRIGAGLAALDELVYAVGGSDATTGATSGAVDALVPGPAPTPDTFRLLGINRGGAISVVVGLFVTVILMASMLRIGRRRPEREFVEPAPEEQERDDEIEEHDAGVSPESAARPER